MVQPTYSVKEVAELLGKTTGWLDRWLRNNTDCFIKIGRDKRLEESDIERIKSKLRDANQPRRFHWSHRTPTAALGVRSYGSETKELLELLDRQKAEKKAKREAEKEAARAARRAEQKSKSAAEALEKVSPSKRRKR
jgi:excisionase family DNA binding protein